VTSKSPRSCRTVLDLLDRPRHPEERLVPLAEVFGQRLDLGQPVPPDRGEAGAVAGAHQFRRVGELHQRVAPIEEDGFQHGSLG
jgi:hypothetical protein